MRKDASVGFLPPSGEAGANPENEGEIAPQQTAKKPPKRKWRVKVYFNESEIAEIARDTADAGFRHGGAIPFIQKKHGFGWEKKLNSKGISKFLKQCWRKHKEIEDARSALKRLV